MGNEPLIDSWDKGYHERQAAKDQALAVEAAKSQPLGWNVYADERRRVGQSRSQAIAAYEEFWALPDLDGKYDPADRVQIQAHQQEFKSEYVRAFETAWAENEGKIPFGFWQDFSIEDLKLFPQTVPREAVEIMYNNQLHASVLASQEVEIEQRAQEILGQKKREGFAGNIVSFFTGIPGFKPEDSPSTMLKKAQEEARKEIMEPASQTEDGFWDHVQRGLPFVMGIPGLIAASQDMDVQEAVGWSFDKAVAGVGWTMQWDPIFGGLMQWSGEKMKQDAERDLAERKEVQGTVDVSAIQYSDNRAAWETTADKDFWIEEAGGNEMMAFGFFAQDRNDDPEIQDQLASFADQLNQEEKDQVRLLEEVEFGAKDQFMNILSWWSDRTGDVAVGAYLLFSDEDIRSDFMQADFGAFLDHVSDHDSTPSKVFGWDGSLLGMFFDGGSMALFDPMTYIYGGGAASAAGRGTIRFADDAVRAVDSAPIVSKQEYVIRAAASGDTTAAAAVTGSGLDGIGVYQLMEVLEFQAPVWGRGNAMWRTAYPHADEVSTDLVGKLVPIEGAKGGSGRAAAAVEKRGGINRPIEIEVSSSGYARIADKDVALAQAAVDNSWPQVPTQIKRIDDVVPGYTPEQVTSMRQHANIKPTETGKMTAAQRKNLLDEIVEETNLTDEVIGGFEKEGETFWVRQTPLDEMGRTTIYVQRSADDVIVSGQLSSGGIVTAKGNQGKGLLREASKISEQTDGPTILSQLLDRADARAAFYDDGATFLRKQIDDKIKGVDEFDTTKAFNVDEVYEGAATVSDDLAAQAPTSFWDSTVSASKTVREQVRDIYLGQLLRNGRLEGVAYTAAARGMQGLVKRLGDSNKFFQHIDSLFTQHNLNRIIRLSKGNAMEDATDLMVRLWGHDADGLNRHMQNLVDSQRGIRAKKELAGRQSSRLNQLNDEIEILKRDIGTMSDDIDQAIFETNDEMKEYGRLRSLEQDRLRKLEKEHRDLTRISIKTRSNIPTLDDVAEIVSASYDDYNRTYLATMDTWKPHVATKGPEKGMVPREILRHGIPQGSDPGKGVVKGTAGFVDDKEASSLLNKISSSGKGSAGYDLGVSPLDMAVAREVGGAMWMHMTHQKTVYTLREGALQLNNIWKIDKVMRPATAAVVSMDEVIRIVHLYGTRAVTQWGMDKAMFFEARVRNAVNQRNEWAFFQKEAVQKGASTMRPQAQERIRRLEDWGNKIRQGERTFFDQHGIGYTDILPDDPMYRQHAQLWAQQFVDDSGFRAYMQGEESFTKWWNESPDAARLQQKAKVVEGANDGTPTSVRPVLREEIYEGWGTMWKMLSSEAKKAGTLDDFTAAWMSTIDEVGSTGKSVPLPGQVFDNFIAVRGAQKVGGGPVESMTETFFDRLFMDPVNYRRGFIAEMVRETELNRLRALYSSQGKSIVPDMALEQMMRRAGYTSPDGPFQGEALAHFWQDSPYIPQSYVTATIERTVEKEIENILFNWSMGSRAGGQAQMLFPFGKPYGDMMGFWGREMLKKPVLRGAFTRDNFLNMENIANSMPVNPKTGAMMSRLAATDMTIDRGFIPEEGDRGEGLLPGSTSTDLSPLFFLPTEGDDILGSMLPGLGYIPLFFLDTVLSTLGPDPVENPIEYNEWVENISFALPYFAYQQGGTVSRVLGGGTISTGLSAAFDITGYHGGQTFFNVTSELGDIGRETRRAREVSVLMADPETIKDLESITDLEELELYMTGLVDEANQNASGSHLAETAGRFTMPAKSRFDHTAVELQAVWVEAAGQFPELLGMEPIDKNSTPEERRQYANDVRTSFFKLESWKKDLMVAANPALAVNMVSSWDWTPKAENAQPPGIKLPYSTGGQPKDYLLHDWYVQNGYVRPIQPSSRDWLIPGAVAEARNNTIKYAYESIASDINDIVWDVVLEERGVEEWLTELVEEHGERLGVSTPRDLWTNWYTLEPLIIENEIANGSTAYNNEDGTVTKSMGMPDKFKPWSVDWPGMTGTSKKFNNATNITFTPEVQAISDELGLNLTEGMTGEQFYNELNSYLTVNDALVYGIALDLWRSFTDERLAHSQSARTQLSMAMNSNENFPKWRTALKDFDTRVENMKEEYRSSPQGIPADLRQEVIHDYNMFVATSKDRGAVPWDMIWDGAFKGVFGARDWEPPEPAPPFDEYDERSPHAVAPFLHDVVDGDTLIVSDERRGDKYAVRLLGVSAREFATDPDNALIDTERLVDRIEQARRDGDTMYIVTDPDRYLTNTDRYGRKLAWLWFGDEPFYFEDEMNPKFTPSGAD